MHENEQLSTMPRSAEKARKRAKLRRNRIVGLTISAVVGIGVLVGTVGSASADPSAGDWLKLRTCESGGNYATNTGNGYYGAYQFDLGTWASIGGSGVPSDASPATQDALAYKLWQERGWSPWTCAAIVGLPEGGSGGPAIQVQAVHKAVKPERTTGHFDSVKLSGDRAHLTVTGWAADLNSAATARSVRITVNGKVFTVRTAATRPDVNRSHHLSGTHGFIAYVPAVAGAYKVCVTALGKTAAHNLSLGCRPIRVPAEVHAAATIAKTAAASVQISGWTYDNRAASRSTKVTVVVDNKRVVSIPANQSSKDIDARFGITGNHRFNGRVWVGVGKHSVCATAVGATSAKRFLGCKTVSFSAPGGSVTKKTVSPGRINLSGWAFDPNSTSSSVKVQIVVNGVVHTVPTNLMRADVNRAHRLTGTHGFQAVVPARKGINHVAVYAMGTTGVAKHLFSSFNVAD